MSRVAGVAGDPLTYYAATAAGGVWKSVNGGTKWESIFDDQPISSIGSIAVAPSDPNVVWVGSGEANIRGNVGEGNGIYRSTDAGETWSHVWKAEGQIGTMAVHPDRPGHGLRGGPRQPVRTRRPSAASSAPPMVERPGRRCCTRTRTPAPPMSASTPRTHASSTPVCGRPGGSRGG